MQDSGWEIKDKDLECYTGPMVLCTKAVGTMILQMDTAVSYMQMETTTKETGTTGMHMEREILFTQMRLDILGTG